MKWSECRTEQAFKMEWIRRHKKEYVAVFPIETEETVKGFPDVLAIHKIDWATQVPYLGEFKKARKGFIHFQPTRPAFYKANPELFIYVISLVEYEAKTYIVSLPANEVLIKLKGTLNVDLRPFCNKENEVTGQ